MQFLVCVILGLVVGGIFGAPLLGLNIGAILGMIASDV